MRLVTYLYDGERRAGVLLGDRVLDTNRADPLLPANVIALLEGGPGALDRLRQVAESTPPDSPAFRPLSEVRLLAPVPRPGKILCVGRNYADHVSEAAAAGLSPMEKPSVFIKVPSAVIGPGDPIVRPVTTDQLDYEGELALVIGRTAKAVSKEDALDYVAGYTIVNDVSARDLQFSKDVGISLGKNFDTALPMGPYLALTDEVPDPGHLEIKTYVNDELRQDSNTHNLIFDIPHIIWYLAQQLTLEPGDVIATGTPSGVGFAMKPPLWLQPGDVVRVEIEGLGALENPVTDG
jgi:2-keto-4-pentenoate hydratase/2-oxohepta-3-ene-1,7-dioic acid hydratase in catechol pathway